MDLRNGPQKWTSEMDLRNGPQKWTSEMDLRNGPGKWTWEMDLTMDLGDGLDGDGDLTSINSNYNASMEDEVYGPLKKIVPTLS
jgi:hypothetical protein